MAAVQAGEAWEEALRAKLSQEEPAPAPDRRPAAVALILRPADRLEALFIHRVEREGDPWSGHISLPGGFRSPADRSLADTARREVREEVAVDVEASCRSLGLLPVLRPVNRPYVEVFPHVFALHGEVDPHPGDEVKSVFWSPLAALRASRSTQRVTASGVELSVPAYVHEGRIVWGLTYRILTTLFEAWGDLGGP